MGFPQVLVLGASGRIGQVLRHCWPKTADLCWQTRRAPRPDGTGQGWCGFDPLADPEALVAAAQGRQAILCLAGSIPGRGGALADNIDLGEATVRAAAGTGAQVFLTSSAAVYGDQSGLLEEAATLRPTAPYGVSKAEMERRAAELGAELGVGVCALRLGNIAGLDAILGGWRPGFQLDVFDDGTTPRRSYIGPQTLARTLAQILTRLMSVQDLPPVLNIAQPGPVEMAQLLQAADLEYGLRPAPPSAIAEVTMDTSRLSELLSQEDPMTAANSTHMVAEWRRLEQKMIKEPPLV
ncbi:NAD-dependent epimerase/dehydratase family protein [Parasedimentitalea huanghaiensis]|uniref:NAD-dependent epimerase/dehydratase family protein n=1 Tax=Parasedimentitalea huanghaiensis TaxID=2682100 RepID=A0A6L6WMS6_9RHOB|nr:NAD(P)-dependent oxidoreductase [Zongyanglinia huanghaiensis]MVO18538.1 NAD-dependent epimerase/dehydratase family protein [Zongyanglinia huanghaiensis]